MNREPVPTTVYYDEGNFYYWGENHQHRRKGMGNRFYDKWKHRITEFKTKADVIAEWDGERRMAFKRIDDEFESRRKRAKERLKWYRANHSPRTDAERLDNLLRGLWGDVLSREDGPAEAHKALDFWRHT